MNKELQDKVKAALEKLGAIHNDIASLIESAKSEDEKEWFDAACGDIEGAMLHLGELI